MIGRSIGVDSVMVYKVALISYTNHTNIMTLLSLIHRGFNVQRSTQLFILLYDAHTSSSQSCTRVGSSRHRDNYFSDNGNPRECSVTYLIFELELGEPIFQD
jgi:hypothetical protein